MKKFVAGRYRFVWLAALVVFSSQLFAQTVIDTITVGRMPTAVALNPKNNRVYVANGLDHTFTVIDGATDAILATMPTFTTPTDIALNTVKNEIWVCESDSTGNLFAEAFNGTTFALIKRIALGVGTGRIAVHVHLNRVYVSNDASTNLSVIDGLHKTLLTTLTLPCSPYGLTVNTATNLWYVGSKGCIDGEVYVIDANTNTLTTTITSTGVSMNYATVDQTHNRVYLTDDVNGMYVVDGATNTLSGLITGLNHAHGVANIAGSQKAVAANMGTNQMKTVNGLTRKVTGTTAVGMSPVGIASNGTTRRIYVANQAGNTVTVLSY
jgi:YVTN family beta-propeller protein